jgi:TatD DNase family protein
MVADSHCHLADPRMRDDADAIVARARDAGVSTIISVGAISSIETDRLAVEIAERHEGIYAAIGVHPHDAKDWNDARLAQLRDLAQSRKVVAIGETGLDFYYMQSPREAQLVSFRRQLVLAAELDKPIVIHCRDAETEVMALVGEVGMPARGGVIHCFTGQPESARRLVEMGFYVSFSGILTFRNAAQVRDSAMVVPLDRLMVETDAPYLAPEPYRGKRNEPAFVLRTLERLADLRGVAPDALGKQIDDNVRRLFVAP